MIGARVCQNNLDYLGELLLKNTFNELSRAVFISHRWCWHCESILSFSASLHDSLLSYFLFLMLRICFFFNLPLIVVFLEELYELSKPYQSLHFAIFQSDAFLDLATLSLMSLCRLDILL